MLALFSVVSMWQLGLQVLSSSHFKQFDPEATFTSFLRYNFSIETARREQKLAEERLRSTFPIGTKISAYSGLTVAPNQFGLGAGNLRKLQSKTNGKVKQVENMSNKIANSKYKIALQVSGSNDFKFFIVNNGNIVPLLHCGVSVWGKLSTKNKSVFSPKRVLIFGKSSRDFIKSQVVAYVALIADMYRNSSFEFVFHSSILERNYKYEPQLKNLDIYLALVNYLLKIELQKLNLSPGVLNKQGKKISWHFINVSKQYFENTNPKLLFKKPDLRRGEFIHRTTESMQKLVEIYLSKIEQIITHQQ